MNEDSIFVEALKQPTPTERAAYLDRACAGDTELRHSVEELLRAHEQAGQFLQPTPVRTTDAAVHDGLETVIGPYKLLQQIGEGGFGNVYMAEQEHPVRRRVALKVIKPGMDSAQIIGRFEAERQALAMMDHQNIARVYDAGTTPNGRPFFVMELVHGIPITKYCDDNHVSPRERLELFIPVCQAIQHAHQKGIIHRDIKPSNVLVTLYDGKPVPKVIDFGVAKAIEQRLTARTMFTQYGTIVGTFEYMAPEQAEMSALGVDTRSDIYSLGVLLYELLTGSTPLERKRLHEAAYSEVVRMIKEEEPVRPSTRISTSGSLPALAAARKTEPGKLARLVQGELDWIVMRCLEKDRARRYETANGLARDLQRYLADEPVEACPPSPGYKFMKFARKYRKAFMTAGAFMVVLALGTLFSTFQAIRATMAKDEARQQTEAATRSRAQADAVTRFLTEDLLLEADPDRNPHAKQVTVVEVLRKAASKIESNPKFVEQPELEAALRLVIGNTLDRLGQPKEAAPHLRRAVDIRRRVLGSDHPDTLDAMEDLAFFLSNYGDAEQSAALSKETYETRVRVLGSDHPKTLESMDTYAGCFTRLGREQEANRLRAECLATRRRVLGEKDRQTLQSMNNQGHDFIEQGRHGEAEPILRQCLQYGIETLGPRSTETFAPRNNLSLAMLYLEKFTDAEKEARQALEICKEVTAPNSRQSLHLQHLLARILIGAGKLDDAEKYATETLTARRETLIASDTNIGRSLVVLGLVLVLKGKYADAELRLREAAAMFRQEPNMDDWIGQAEMIRAAALVGQGRMTEGDALLAQAWPKYATEKRIMPWQRRATLNAVAAAYEHAGKKAEAEIWRARIAAGKKD